MSAGVRRINRTLQLRSIGSSTGLYAIPRYYTREKYTFRNISARARTACRLNRFPVKINWISGRVSSSLLCPLFLSHSFTFSLSLYLTMFYIEREKMQDSHGTLVFLFAAPFLSFRTCHRAVSWNSPSRSMDGFQSVHPAYTSEYDIGGGTTYIRFRLASVYVSVGWEYDKVLYACIEDDQNKRNFYSS